MKRTLGGAALVVVLAVAGFLAVPSSESVTMRCTLTGETVEECCCEMHDGKIYCPLAEKTVETCCCVAEGRKGTESR